MVVPYGIDLGEVDDYVASHDKAAVPPDLRDGAELVVLGAEGVTGYTAYFAGRAREWLDRADS